MYVHVDECGKYRKIVQEEATIMGDVDSQLPTSISINFYPKIPTSCSCDTHCIFMLFIIYLNFIFLR